MGEKKEKIDKVVIIISKNSLEDVYAGLIMANGAVMEGIETIVFFTFLGLDAITKKTMNNLKIGNVQAFLEKMPQIEGKLDNAQQFVTEQIKNQFESMDFPTVEEFMEMIDGGGGKIYACKLAADMFRLTQNDFCPEVKGVISVGEMYEMSAGAPIIFI